MDDERAAEATTRLLAEYAHRVSAAVRTPVPPAQPAMRPGPGRRVRVLGAALVAVVAAATVAGLLVFGPRSTSNPPPAALAPTGPGRTAVLAPAHAVAPAVLERSAAVVRRRLRSLGAGGAAVTVRAGTVVVSGPGVTPALVAVVAEPGALFVRPVLCGAPAQSAPAPTTTSGADSGTRTAAGTLSCGAAYATTAANLGVDPDSQAANGYQANPPIPPDPAFAGVASTPADRDDPAQRVLLPADPAGNPQQYSRFVLGPAEMDSRGVVGARATYQRDEAGWIVTVQLDGAGQAQWDAAARRSFHAYLAFDVDATVVSAPIIEPVSTTYSSFRGQMVLAGFSRRGEATDLAALLDSGALPVRLELRSLTAG